MKGTASRVFVLALLLMFVLALASTSAQTPVRIELWHWWGDQAEEFDKLLERFHAAYPDIQVEAVSLPFSDRESKALLALLTDTGPDVLMATRSEVIRFADRGLIVPIEPYIDKAGIDLGDFYPGEVEAFRWNGVLWTLPMPTVGGNESLVYYNRDLLGEVGLNPDALPETWKDLEELARRVNRTDGNVITRLGFDVATFNRFNAMLYANAGNFLDPTLRKVAFNGPEGLEALTWMFNYTHEYNGGYAALEEFITGGGITRRFMEGRVAGVFGGIAQFSRYRDAGINVALGLIPYNDENPAATFRGVSGRLFGWGYVIPRHVPEEKRDAAFTFIKFLTTDLEGGCRFLQAQARPSPLRHCNADPIYREVNPYWHVIGQALELDVPFPITPVHDDIDRPFDRAFLNVMRGIATPEGALEELARHAQAILDAYWSEVDR